MSIVAADIKFKAATYNNDLAGNGGRMTANDVGTTLFPDITAQERTSGVTRYRKEFMKNEENSSGLKDLTLMSPRVWLSALSPAEDYFRLKAGSDTDTQSTAEGYSDWAGVGYLDANKSAGALSIAVNCEAANGFYNGLAYITDGTNAEFFTISGVSWATLKTTLTVSGSIGLAHAYDRYFYSATADIYTTNTIGKTGAGWTYSAYVNKYLRIVSGTGIGQMRRIISNTTTTATVDYNFTTTPDGTSVFEILKTYVSMVVELSDIVASWSGWSEVSTSGTYNETNYPPLLYPIGSITETWTLTMTSSTNFDVYGAVVGFVGSGIKTSNFTPANGSSYYFQLRLSGWGGTWAMGETITFTTTHSAKALWIKEVVTAGINPYSNNRCQLAAQGDSA